MKSHSPTDAIVTVATIDDPRRRRSILLAVCIALMAVVSSVSGLAVAQPQLAVSFDASQDQVLWMINIYTITLAALLLPLGAAGDRWGRRPVLLTGLLVFAVANIAAGFAPSIEVMLAARLLSGVSAAMIMPVTLSVITSTFPDQERSKAIGVWTAVAGGGGILGMYLSALLVDVATWRWLFLLPVVLVILAGVFAVRSVPNIRERATHRFDVVGALASIVVTLGFSFALHEGPAQGWTAPIPLTSLLLAIMGTATFVLWELRHPAPLLNIRYFGSRGLSSGSTVMLMVFGVQAGVSIVLFPFFQTVLGWTGLLSTLGLLPMAVLSMVASGLAPRLAARVGARAAMASGVALVGGGLALMATLVSVNGGYLAVLPGMMLVGWGMGLAMTPSTEAITSSLPREQQGVASALNDVTRELGAALGVALLGALLTAGYRASIDPRLNGLPDSLAGTAREGIANAIAGATGSPFADQVIQAAQEAFVAGWQQAMWAGAAVMAALLVLVVLRGPQRRGPGQMNNEQPQEIQP